MKQFTVTEECTLENFTDNTYAQASFCFRTLLKEREIRVNGKKVGENLLLHAGDEVCYYLTQKQQEKQAFCVIYEDENVLVVDKESGVNSEAVYSALKESGARFIHRLDRNTEGLLLFAKTEGAEEELKRAFMEHRVKKVYNALVFGTPAQQHAVLTAYLKKDGNAAEVNISQKPIGEKIVTEYEVLEPRGACTLLKVTLHTGKTHQIRAHLAFIGLPVVGDMKYGDSLKNRKFHAVRQRLLSKELCVFCEGELAYLKERTFFSKKTL